MNKFILSLSVLFIVLFISGPAFSQDDESMKKWQDYMTPGDIHKMLAKGTGSWKSSATFWMAPGTEPMKSEGTATGEMILGGRYLMSKYSGKIMGMDFEGIAIEGYDNAVKMFMSTWIDNMGTGIMFLEGTWDEANKQITYKGRMVDPMAGNWVDVREVVTYNSDGSTKMEMYGPDPSGKEFKTMEIVFTKQ
ncbi:MAG: DUF1579 domain-containing protein [Chlorobi bacterium]|nr:DUF1579 domain-containing protein [Chlorobiota bacterium]MCI0717271.1 DUF1579 domain-containing protein [Chlorobiota bacterium]